MYDEDAIFELGEQIKANTEEAMRIVCEHITDITVRLKIMQCISGPLEDLVDKIYEEVGIEFCEECGGRLYEHCTCEDEGEPEEDEEAEEAEEAEA